MPPPDNGRKGKGRGRGGKKGRPVKQRSNTLNNRSSEGLSNSGMNHSNSFVNDSSLLEDASFLDLLKKA